MGAPEEWSSPVSSDTGTEPGLQAGWLFIFPGLALRQTTPLGCSSGCADGLKKIGFQGYESHQKALLQISFVNQPLTLSIHGRLT